MRRFVTVFALFVLGIAGCNQTSNLEQVSNDSNPESTTAVSTPSASTSTTEASPSDRSEQFLTQMSALESQLETDLANLTEAVQAAPDNERKRELLESGNPVPTFVDQMLELSLQYSDVPQAVDANLAAISRSKGAQKHRGMLQLLDNFCDRLKYQKMITAFLREIPSPETESYLKTMIDNAKEPEDQAAALLGLSNYIDQIFPFRKALEANPHLAARLPASQMRYINTPRSEQQQSEREQALQRLIDEFGDLKYRGGRSYGDVASAELYELQNLRVGKIAPNIVGKDLDGIEFKLADYRGKIVMLDFWGHWCRPCQEMYPHEQKLVEKLGKAPFALIGINTDQEKQTAVDAVRDENLTWRNYWDGPRGTAGPISSRWNITAWPTVYLIDADGVVRHKDILGDDLNEALEQMLAEMGHEIDLTGLK